MDAKKPKDSHFPSVFVVGEEGLARQRWGLEVGYAALFNAGRVVCEDWTCGAFSPALGPFSKGLTHFHGCWHVLGLLFFWVLCSCRGCKKPAVLCSQGLESHVHPIKGPHGVPSFVIQVDMGSSFFKTQRGNNFPLVLPLTYRKGGTTKSGCTTETVPT